MPFANTRMKHVTPRIISATPRKNTRVMVAKLGFAITKTPKAMMIIPAMISTRRSHIELFFSSAISIFTSLGVF
jgi:hypothetical protein